jgi:hypothetical protein
MVIAIRGIADSYRSPVSVRDNDKYSSPHPTTSLMRAPHIQICLNTTYVVEELDRGYVGLSPPHVLRPSEEMYHRIYEHLPDNCSHQIVLAYEVGHRWTEFVVGVHES